MARKSKQAQQKDIDAAAAAVVAEQTEEVKQMIEDGELTDPAVGLAAAVNLKSEPTVGELKEAQELAILFPADEVVDAEPTIDELKARVAELETQLAEKQAHILWTSKAPKPVALVREIFCEMFGKVQRKDVIAACVKAGIAANTAKTQYQILKGKAERGELEELNEEVGESEE